MKLTLGLGPGTPGMFCPLGPGADPGDPGDPGSLGGLCSKVSPGFLCSPCCPVPPCSPGAPATPGPWSVNRLPLSLKTYMLMAQNSALYPFLYFCTSVLLIISIQHSHPSLY